MKDNFELKGFVTTVITPFTEDNQIDIASLEREIDTSCNAGAAGFLVPCLASELPLLSFEERKLLVQVTTRVAAGRAKVITSVNADNPEDRIRLMHQFLEYGCNGINIMVPYTTDEDYLRDIAQLDKEKPPFLLLQDADFDGPGLKDELIVQAFEQFDSVVGAKVEVKYSGPKYTRLLQKTGGKMVIASGWGNDQLIELLDRGVHAIMPSGLFELWGGICSRYFSGDREGAKKLFYDMLPIVTFTRQDQALNRSFHKRYFKAAGIFSTAISREEVLWDEIHDAYANELIQRGLELVAALK